MISYILYAATSILAWNVSVALMNYLGVAFYSFNPSLVIIPTIVFIKLYKDFKSRIDIKKMTVVYWINYLILIFCTYFIYYFLYVKGFIQTPVIYIFCILFFYLFLVLQNVITLYILGLEKKPSLYPFIIMLFSFIFSVIITLVKFQILYGTCNLVFIWSDFLELVKEGFFVEYVIIYQLTLIYYVSKKGNPYLIK